MGNEFFWCDFTPKIKIKKEKKKIDYLNFPQFAPQKTLGPGILSDKYHKFSFFS